jgi:hypothetical protein
LKSHNLGTSYLVAPINHTSNERLKSNFSEVQSFLRNKNDSYIKVLMGDEEDQKVIKKSPTQIKIENMNKMLEQNQRGRTINNRTLKSPHPGFAKKLIKDNFRTNNNS